MVWVSRSATQTAGMREVGPKTWDSAMPQCTLFTVNRQVSPTINSEMQFANGARPLLPVRPVL